MTSDDRTVLGWIRPLSLPSIGTMPSLPVENQVDPISLLRDLCQGSESDPIDAIRRCYVRLFRPDLDIFLVPADKLILDKIVWPLRSAKRCFCLGDFLGCIGECGMVAEMAIVFLCDLMATTVDLAAVSLQIRTIFVDRAYEKLRQDERIKHLRKAGVRYLYSDFREDRLNLNTDESLSYGVDETIELMSAFYYASSEELCSSPATLIWVSDLANIVPKEGFEWLIHIDDTGEHDNHMHFQIQKP